MQKVLSRAGVASRRKAEELILAGRVRVGGRVVTELGTRVDPEHDRVELDGKRLIAEQRAYIVLHKPRGVMCTMSDPEGRPTVAELVRGVGARVVPVGRLDFHTSGVLLLTNDGDFAAVLGHPSKEAPKTYVAKVRGVVDADALARLGESIEIDGRATRPASVTLIRLEGDKSWIEVTLREGRNRQVRRLGDSAGLPVLRLVRQSFAGVDAAGLRPGEWRHLTVDELTEIKREFGVPKRVRGVEMVAGVHGKLATRAPTGDRKRQAEAQAARRGRGDESERAKGWGANSYPRSDERDPRATRGGGPWRTADERRPERSPHSTGTGSRTRAGAERDRARPSTERDRARPATERSARPSGTGSRSAPERARPGAAPVKRHKRASSSGRGRG